jgi:hypothetical protein
MTILTDTPNEFSTGTTTLSLMSSFLLTANSPYLPHGTTLFVFGILTLVSQPAVSSDTHPMFSQLASAPTTDKSSLDHAIRQSNFGILWASASMTSRTTATPSGQCGLHSLQETFYQFICRVSCVRFSPNVMNPVIVSCGWDKVVKVRDIKFTLLPHFPLRMMLPLYICYFRGPSTQ